MQLRIQRKSMPVHRAVRTLGWIALAGLCLICQPAAQSAEKEKNSKKPPAKAPAKKPQPKPAAKAPPKFVAKPSTPPLKALRAPESSAAKADTGQTEASKSMVARLQAQRTDTESEIAFLRLLQTKLPVGLWSADRVVDDDDDTTLLHYAAMKGWMDATKYLLEQGANPESRNILGKTPAILARELGHTGIRTVLDEASAARAAATSRAPP